ncbi:transglycosylase SLT domain-containing protein [Leadbettera azotonutricia]|uniref:transglycosylase SLT domain-containing protein n=1 Tax=Leadbettera azotonutricia TaxID=150829 RepID=UPI0002D59107|nr:transglycosylase SLT domain-containing protein [Leadbettera azotonutricia]
MRTKEIFTVFWVFLAVGLISLSIFSCTYEEKPAQIAAELSEAEKENLFFRELAGPVSGFTAHENADTILDAYRNETTRDQVVAFFEKITNSRELAAVVLSNAAAVGVSPALAFSLCWEESCYNPRAVNKKNRNLTIDRGLFQLNSASFPDLEEEDFYNPSINAWYGLSHLRWCLDNAGTEVAGLAMYNAGTGRVRNGGPQKHPGLYFPHTQTPAEDRGCFPRRGPQAC